MPNPPIWLVLTKRWGLICPEKRRKTFSFHGAHYETHREGSGAFGHGVLQEKARALLVMECFGKGWMLLADSQGASCGALRRGTLLVNSHGVPCGAFWEGTLLVNSHGGALWSVLGRDAFGEELLLLVNSRLAKRVGAPPFDRAPLLNTS